MKIGIRYGPRAAVAEFRAGRRTPAAPHWQFRGGFLPGAEQERRGRTMSAAPRRTSGRSAVAIQVSTSSREYSRMSDVPGELLFCPLQRVGGDPLEARSPLMFVPGR